MGEINHFSHEEHSLKLIENWETIVDDHGKKKDEVHCEGCGETISIVGGSAYGCISCRYFLHKKCAELRPTIDLHYHPLHPLTLIVRRINWYCDLCRTRHLARHFSYYCSECDFDACIKCGSEHSLKLIENWETIFDDHGEKKGEVHCEGCGETISIVGGSAYGCISCCYFLHKKCAELRPTIDLHYHPLHPLTLIVHRVPWQCNVCRTHHLPRRFCYYCSECDLNACIKCGSEHSLKLIENWETIVNDHDEKKGEVQCEGCREPISILGGSAYGCISCRYFLHKKCAELRPTINHHLHPFHPLTLYHNSRIWNCNVCHMKRLAKGFSYRCFENCCDFEACVKCGADVVSEKASMKLQHEGHPGHTLTLQLRPASFRCDACRAEDKDFFYQCDSCNFWIHKTCASLDPTINLPGHHHPLVLVYLLPDNFYNFKYYCEFCEAHIVRNDWLYHCAKCRYFSHIKCALNALHPSSTRDPAGTSAEEQGN